MSTSILGTWNFWWRLQICPQLHFLKQTIRQFDGTYPPDLNIGEFPPGFCGLIQGQIYNLAQPDVFFFVFSVFFGKNNIAEPGHDQRSCNQALQDFQDFQDCQEAPDFREGKTRRRSRESEQVISWVVLVTNRTITFLVGDPELHLLMPVFLGTWRIIPWLVSG